MKPFKDRQAPPPKVPAEVDCPECGARVATEVLRGRVRWVVMTIVHLKPNSPTATVCYAILKTEEHRDRTA